MSSIADIMTKELKACGGGEMIGAVRSVYERLPCFRYEASALSHRPSS